MKVLAVALAMSMMWACDSDGREPVGKYRVTAEYLRGPCPASELQLVWTFPADVGACVQRETRVGDLTVLETDCGADGRTVAWLDMEPGADSGRGRMTFVRASGDCAPCEYGVALER